VEGRRGIQAEILVSLAVVMVTATGLLSAFFFKTHAAQIDRLRDAVGRALIAEVRSPTFSFSPGSEGATWWTVSPDGAVRAKTPGAGALDAAGLALAQQAREVGAPLLETGAPWQPIRFAARSGSAGAVAVARLPAAVSRWAVALLLVADGAVFLALGAFLLRQRVVAPLRRLGAAAASLAEGGLGARVVVEGVAEVADVAWAFNEMGEALERRTLALEKAVGDLREANRSLRRARAGLDRAERLAAVGRLAAGVAHEVGNPMGALLAFLDLAKRDASLSEDARAHLARAEGEGERVRRILRQLLDFSRPPRPERVPVDLRRAAEQTAGLLRAQKRYAEIAIQVECARDCGPVLADAAMVGQILLNLALNAADAVRGRPEPRLVLRVRPAALERRRGDEGEAAARRGRHEAVECVVADNGPGIPEEDRERIFDPFFTTKAPGEGTGLGLSNALRLAEELGGQLDLATGEPLGGAAFALRLPVAESGSASQRVRA
jgi:two-component system NtrC family sensor kinase